MADGEVVMADGEVVMASRRARGYPGYVVITPCRDEARCLPELYHSMLRQTVRPLEWVLVDDGSTDGTSTIIDSWAAELAWIRAVHLNAPHRRGGGSPIVKAFMCGLSTLSESKWEYLVKLDADLVFPPLYFSDCVSFLESHPAYGIAGGEIRSRDGRRVIREVTPAFHVRGATKIYRRSCWDSLEGLLMGPGWDTVDEVKANLLGWKTGTLAQCGLYQQRRTGARSGTWANSKKDGTAYFASGYLPAYLLARCLFRLVTRPSTAMASLGVLVGYVRAYGNPRVLRAATNVRKYLGKQQLRRLLGRDSIWR